MQVSFIIPLYNCLALTQAMVTSLVSTLPSGLTYEVILVDDGSTDGTRAWLQTLAAPFRVVLNDRNRGYAFSNNRGAELAQGEILALLNNDLVLLPGWLPPMLRVLRRESLAGIVGNLQLDARTGALDHAGIVVNLQGKPEHARTLSRFSPARLLGARRVPAVTGACLVIERALWRQLGGFDESFVNGGEDVDLCFRAQLAYRATYVATRSVVLHHISSSPGRKSRDEANSYRLAQKWRPQFIAAATRLWCRDFIRQRFARPDQREYALTCRALFHGAGILAKAPPEAVAGLDAALGREFARWETMFPG